MCWVLVGWGFGNKIPQNSHLKLSRKVYPIQSDSTPVTLCHGTSHVVLQNQDLMLAKPKPLISFFRTNERHCVTAELRGLEDRIEVGPDTHFLGLLPVCFWNTTLSHTSHTHVTTHKQFLPYPARPASSEGPGASLAGARPSDAGAGAAGPCAAREGAAVSGYAVAEAGTSHAEARPAGVGYERSAGKCRSFLFSIFSISVLFVVC